MLIAISDSLNIGNKPAQAKVYNTENLGYSQINSVDSNIETEITNGGYVVEFKPDSRREGVYIVKAVTDSGIIHIAVRFLTEYEKDEQVINSARNYYPENMFAWESDNPKYTETEAVDELFKQNFSHWQMPIANEFPNFFGDYASSQILGIAAQFALDQWNRGNGDALVLWTKNLKDVNSKKDFLEFLKPEDQGGYFVYPSNSLGKEDAPPKGNILANKESDKTYGVGLFAYNSWHQPKKYHVLKREDGSIIQLKYGATLNDDGKLQYTARGKVVYVGQTDPSIFNDLFQWEYPRYSHQQFEQYETSTLTRLHGWRDITGMPATNEVIYVEGNIDCSDIKTKFIVPRTTRFVTEHHDFIAWSNWNLPAINKVVILFDGEDFKIGVEHAYERTFFAFEGNKTKDDQGFNEGVWY